MLSGEQSDEQEGRELLEVAKKCDALVALMCDHARPDHNFEETQLQPKQAVKIDYAENQPGPVSFPNSGKSPTLGDVRSTTA